MRLRPSEKQDAVESVASASNSLKWRIQDASELLTETVSDAVATASDNLTVRCWSLQTPAAEVVNEHERRVSWLAS